MPAQVSYPAVGSRWKERDRRVERTIQVVRHDPANRRVRIYCVETEQLSWAKPERFNGRSGGYIRWQGKLPEKKKPRVSGRKP